MPEKSTTPDQEEILRRGVEAFNRRDFDAAVAIYSRDVVYDMSPMGTGVFEGREAVRGLFEDWLAAYEDYEAELAEFRDLGNGVTFLVLIHRGRPAGSIGLVEFDHSYAATWTDGLVNRVTVHTDIDDGRAAAERLAEERG